MSEWVSVKSCPLTSSASTGRKRVEVATFDMTSVTPAMMTLIQRAMAGAGNPLRESSCLPIHALRPDSCRCVCVREIVCVCERER